LVSGFVLGAVLVVGYSQAGWGNVVVFGCVFILKSCLLINENIINNYLQKCLYLFCLCGCLSNSGERS